MSSQTSSLAQTLKLEQISTARTTLNNHNLRKERVLEYKHIQTWAEKIATSLLMRQIPICIFVENLVDQKQGSGSKILLPSRRGIIVTIIGTICGKGVIDLTLRKPEAAGSKKRRRGDSKAEDVDVNATAGTRNDYFLE